MCTLVVATRVWDAAPLVVAANRDEQRARPASPPHRWARDGDPPIFAPRDLRAGGTWLGVRGASLFVGITNRWGGGTPPTGPRSRGQLVLDALVRGQLVGVTAGATAGGTAGASVGATAGARADSSVSAMVGASMAEAAAEYVAGLDPAMHAPFHLVMADRLGAHLVWNDGQRHHYERLAPGIHVISERSRGAALTGRDGLLRRRLEALGSGEPELSTWRALLSEHTTNPLEGPCVHADALGYGTRCSTVVRLPAAGGIGFFHADGPPCVTDYVDHCELAAQV